MAFGAYVLEERIAVGGMAEVFRARDRRARVGAPRSVVIKRMLPHLAKQPGAHAMLEAEARHGAAISHPNVVRVLDSGAVGAEPYLVLEHVRGVDLWRFVRHFERHRRAIDLEIAIFIATELLAGLDAVHRARDARGRALDLLHRDVSPSNVLLSLHGDVKLGDLGIARRLVHETFPGAALGDRAKGKLAYLSPEQVRGQPVDQRADVFAAAVVTAELIVGQSLFARASELETLIAIRDARVDVLDARASGLPAGLVRALRRALEADPDARIGSARALRDELAAFAAGPESVLRAALAGLVAEAHAARKPTDPAVRIGEETPLVATPGAGRTADLPTLDYYVRRTGGERVGPLSFAAVVEALATRRIGPDDLVAAVGEDLVSVAAHPDLARHLPAASAARASVVPTSTPPTDESMSGRGFVHALSRLVATRATGLLECERGSVRKEIFFVDGCPEFVTSNQASELLGEFLVARGVLSRGELDMALAVLPRFDGKLGDTLVALDLLDAVSLYRHIARQVKEKLLDLFVWESGVARFTPDVERPVRGFPLDLDAWRILAEGAARRVSAHRDDDLLSARLSLGEPVPEAARLPARARSLVDDLRAPSTGGEIVDARVAAGELAPAVLRNLVLLVGLGAVRVS